jgi:hypothetical protein
MKERDSREWIWPPLGQWVLLWGMLVIAIIGIVTAQVASWFRTLTHGEWIRCYNVAVLFGIIGVGLIFYAKLPAYREHRFFTFGAGALPVKRRTVYRWGYRCAILSGALFACLWLWGHG